MRMRVGIMGGTFDPVHCGHLQIAEAARKALALDEILLLPAGDPPHKGHLAPMADRWEMTRLAAEAAGFTACAEEIERAGTTYTVDTLTAFHRRRPEAEWFYIVGADALSILGKWRRFDEVAELCAFAVARRPGVDADWLAARAAELRERFGAKLIPVDAAGPDISSTEIRARVAEGRSIAGMVPPAEEAYILEKGLYLVDMDEEELLERLRGQITEKRYRHTLGVAETAERLAKGCGVSPGRARLAGQLHDCAKSLTMEEMRRQIREAGIPVDPMEWDNEFVLHAPAGAARAKLEYGVRDGELLTAIRWHTLGGPDLTALEALIYVADAVEPGRKPYPGIEETRALAEKDIFAAARLCARQSADYVRSRGGTPHPRSLAMFQNEESRTE